MLWSDDIEEILRAAAAVNTARACERADRTLGLVDLAPRAQRPAVEVAEEELELQVRVAVRRTDYDPQTEEAVRREVERRADEDTRHFPHRRGGRR